MGALCGPDNGPFGDIVDSIITSLLEPSVNINTHCTT